VGREFGVHLLAAMQDPTAKHLGDTAIKNNMTTRLVGKVANANSAVVATGLAGSGAERLTGSGDFLMVQPDGTRRLTAALLTSRDMAQLPRAEAVGTLDLEQYDDVDHVLAQADIGGRGRPLDPVEPKHVALALVEQRGVTWLARELGIGSGKAARVREFADAVIDELLRLGYTNIPIYRKALATAPNTPT
jgi:DNA segregation ATPase FtsK/SpoIIIE-like protein